MEELQPLNLLDLNMLTTDENSIQRLRRRLNSSPQIIPQGYLAWFKTSVVSTKSKEELEKLITQLENNDNYTCSEEFTFLDIFTIQLHTVFLYILIDNQTRFEEMLEISRNRLENFRTTISLGQLYQKNEEHLVGAEFVLKSLNTLANLQFGTPLENNTMPTFADLSPKAKAFVLVAEYKFIGDLFPSWNKEFDLINEAIQLDNHWEWNLIQFNLLRWRRRGRDHRTQPSPEEKAAIEIAYELNPTHPLCIYRMLECMSEFLKKNGRTFIRFPMEIAGTSFNGVHEIVTFLKKVSMRFLEEFPVTGSWLNQFGKMFSSDFPSEYRDPVLARAFLTEALNRSPNSSKINHRMGIFLCQNRDYSNGEIYLAKAVELDDRNKPAISDKITVLMRNNSNSVELTEFFENFEPFSDLLDMDLQFLKGYFYFSSKLEDEAIRAWLKWAQLIEGNQSWTQSWIRLKFQKLDSMSYPWGWNKINLRLIVREVQDALTRFTPQCGDQASLETLQRHIYEAAEPDRNRYRYPNPRPGRYQQYRRGF